MSDERKDKFLEDILRKISQPGLFDSEDSLRQLFNNRIQEIGISTTSALELVGIQSKTFNGILDGTQKQVDYTSLIRLASFLQVPKERVFSLYAESLERNYPQESFASTERMRFIQENFDLAALRRAGFIQSIVDFTQIEERLNSFLGLRSILEYRRPVGDVAFSAGVVQPKDNLTRSFWIKTAGNIFDEISNPFAYDRQALIEYFPQIRRHSMDIRLGLMNVVRHLYRLGVTVIYQAPLPSLHLRGATFASNGKPCIVLTDYRGFYPTLWFSLIHELFHVLFDWEEIRSNRFHLSDESSDEMTVNEKEMEADNFAREYLFSKEKTKKVRKWIRDPRLVADFATSNHVHSSFAYVFNAYDVGKGKNRAAWGIANINNPGIIQSVELFSNPWEGAIPIPVFVKNKLLKLYK